VLLEHLLLKDSMTRVSAIRLVVPAHSPVGACLAAAFTLVVACGPPAAPAESPAAAPAVTNDDRARVIAFIMRARSERGLRPVDVLEDAPPLDTAAAMIRRGATPEQAMEVAMQRVVELESSEARGWCIPTTDLDAVELPSVVLERDEVTLAVVAVQKEPGALPPPFVVCILVLEDGSDFQGSGM
jgi:hypothetical protein